LTPEIWLSASADKVIETHCAWVFLGDRLAWKIKKPVDLGYLDFSTIQRRRWAIERELAFNKASAPDIYRAVRAITRKGEAFEFDGEGEVVDYALEMRRFDTACVLDACPERVDGALADDLGRTVAQLHARAPVKADGGGADALAYTVTSNAEHLRALAPLIGDVEPLIAATEEALKAAAPLLDRRKVEGFARRCHGDLHLGNILLEQGRPVLFDCIEFNDRLSEIDVLYDLAFLLMDLDFRGRRDAANRVLSAYLDEAARTFPDTLWSGLAALPPMLSVRAAVRCHVRAQAGATDEARAYLVAAMAHLSPAPPVLCAVGGRSGSGKSTFARILAPHLGRCPGAVVLRTDEIRKRLCGAGPLEPLPKEAYDNRVTKRVYRRLFEEAEACLEAGQAVVLDAVFMRPAELDEAAALAKSCNVPFAGAWLDAPAEVLRARVAARTNDASDADVRVLAMQLAQDPGDVGWIRIEAQGDFTTAALALASAVSN
jgi:aminoglycoside phosphotransferase family enzyme/predicted kinase